MINYSFIIPHKNCPKLLQRCLESIPDRGDIEILVIDDNSDQRLIPIINKDNAKLINIPYNESKGAGHARNVGLDLAVGRWLLFTDCDDFYEKDFMVDLDQYVNSSFDFIVFDAYWAIDLSNGKVLRDYYKYCLKDFIEERSDRKKLNRVKHGNNACWNKMISRDYVLKIDARFEEVPACNDAWFVQYVGANTDNIEVINKKLYYYVKTPGSISHKRMSMSTQLQIMKTIGRVHRYLDDIGAWYCVPRFTNGIRLNFNKYGFWGGICIYTVKLFVDVPPHKRLYHWLFRR